MGAAARGALRHQAQARAKAAAWIEDYNTTRRHSSLGMLSPLAYERALAAGKEAA
jgi:putative transposase